MPAQRVASDYPPHNRRGLWQSLLICLTLTLLGGVSIGPALAHPEDEFCVPGEGGLDPALCEALNNLQSSEPLQPLLDEQGEERSTVSTVWLYWGIGVDHILPGGLDHILFVLALFLASSGLRPLLLQVTMFTLAHSLTLGMAALGWVQLNAAWVEALIAATIAFIAVENLVLKQLPPWRLPLVFGFGLLHGLGFAGFFSQFRLPEHQFMAGLVGFNLGVEAGQLAVLLVAAILVWPLRSLLFKCAKESAYRHALVVPGSLAIGMVGVFWTIERLLAV